MFGADKIGCYGCLGFLVTSNMLARELEDRHLKSKIRIQPIRHAYRMELRLCELSRAVVLYRRWIRSQTFTPAEQLSYCKPVQTKNCRLAKSGNFFVLILLFFFNFNVLRRINIKLIIQQKTKLFLYSCFVIKGMENHWICASASVLLCKLHVLNTNIFPLLMNAV